MFARMLDWLFNLIVSPTKSAEKDRSYRHKDWPWTFDEAAGTDAKIRGMKSTFQINDDPLCDLNHPPAASANGRALNLSIDEIKVGVKSPVKICKVQTTKNGRTIYRDSDTGRMIKKLDLDKYDTMMVVR